MCPSDKQNFGPRFSADYVTFLIMESRVGEEPEQKQERVLCVGLLDSFWERARQGSNKFSSKVIQVLDMGTSRSWLKW